MKKLITLTAALLLVVSIPAGVLAAAPEKITFQPEKNKYTIDDTEFTMDAVPFISKGRIYVPIRFLADALGIDNKLITWDKSTGKVIIPFRGDNHLDIVLQTGSRQLIINYLNSDSNTLFQSKAVPMDTEPVIQNGRIYLPARWVAEACGFNVEWDSDQNLLICTPADTEEVKVDTQQIESSTDSLSLNMQIPVISGMANKTLQENINKEIMDNAMRIKTELENDCQEYLKDAEEYNFPVHQYELYVTYKAYTNGGVLSLVVETYQYTGGAHGITWRDYYNLDIQNGKRLSLHELFKDGTDYVNIINKEIKKQIADRTESGQGVYFEGDMGFQSISENHPFYIKDKHIVICFSVYEIAPYVTGMPEFQLPNDIFSQQWREDILNLLQYN